MSKTTLRKAVEGFTATASNYTQEITTIDESGMYTPAGAQEQKNSIKEKYVQQFAALADKIAQEITAANEAAQQHRAESIAANLQNGAFQLALQNVAEVIATRSELLEEDQKAIAAAFAGDPLAAAMIKSAVKKTGAVSQYTALIPVDKGSEALETLEQISSKLLGYSMQARSGSALSGYALGKIEIYLQKLDEYFTEDFGLI